MLTESELKQRGHENKMQYSGPLPARNAAIAIGWVSQDPGKLHAYYCVFCDYWHIGHKSNKKRKTY